jgi:hypothetical protein
MIATKVARKYNSHYRKKLVNKISKLNNKEDYIDIYNIIINDIGTNFSSNINGLFLNVNLLSDNCIEGINMFLDKKLINNVQLADNTSITLTSYKSIIADTISDSDYKLSNQEKNIIKRFRNANTSV